MKTLSCGCKVKWFDRPGPDCFSVKPGCAVARRLVLNTKEMAKHLRRMEAVELEPTQQVLL